MRVLSLSCALLALLATGCARLDHFGKPPEMSSVDRPKNAIDPQVVTPRAPLGSRDGSSGAAAREAARLRAGGVETGDLPERGYSGDSRAASLWSRGPTSPFSDHRARRVGDIVTVVIEIDDEAEISNSTSRSRSGSDNVTVGSLFGAEGYIDRIIPGDAGVTPGVSASGSTSSTGDGSVSREEQVTLRIAATVIDVLPNGHLVISGNQEVRVNFELRDLQVAGVVRTVDVTRQNTITYDKIANARISYGGRGQITDVQQPRYGQQVIDMISPF